MNEVQAWAASGGMALTGRPEGPPCVAPGVPATYTNRALERIERATALRTGTAPSLPGVRLLGERAAAAGLRRNGPWSCGGAFRALPTMNGWLGLSLARAEDVDLAPALTGAAGPSDPWERVASWAARVTTQEGLDRSRLLGLAACALPVPATVGRPGVASHMGVSRTLPERPRILDLTSLWAGPLCAHLLGLGGAEVTKVESTRRPDGARFGARSFFDLLHAGHESLSLDFRSSTGLARLRELIESSDLVLEGSRRRALLQLGIVAEDFVEAGISWLSITAHGRDHNVIGFGDDVAAGGGLYLVDGEDVLPCGDALADPLAGVAAAAAAAEALLESHSSLLDVSMHDVAREAAAGDIEPHRVIKRRRQWWVECSTGFHLVEDPQARKPRS